MGTKTKVVVVGIVLLAVAGTLYQKNPRTNLVGGYPADKGRKSKGPMDLSGC